MRPAEIRELIKVKPVQWNAIDRTLSRCHDISDLRRVARKRTPRPVFDYVDGGADDEQSMAANVAAFASHTFLPTVLRDTTELDTRATLFGRQLTMPVVLGPTGYTRMMHPDGELAVARAAAAHGLPYVLSTVATTSIEDVAKLDHHDLWFQLYLRRDRDLAMELVRRARDNGYQVLEITVDTPVSGRRLRDVRNGLTIPPELTAGALLDIAIKPAYWARMLRNPPIIFANAPLGKTATVETITSQFDPSITWDHLELVRQHWQGPLVLKGLFGPDDARRAVELGVDGLHLSNHGGRQLDRIATPLDVLPAVRAAVGPDYPLLLDSGVRSGADIVTALALGADSVAIGRVYLYGLMAAGQPGVRHALSLLSAQLRRTMQLIGRVTLAEIREAGPSLFMPESTAASRPQPEFSNW